MKKLGNSSVPSFDKINRVENIPIKNTHKSVLIKSFKVNRTFL